ncbi:unnamed protein product [Rotaria socialis]
MAALVNKHSDQLERRQTQPCTTVIKPKNEQIRNNNSSRNDNEWSIRCAEKIVILRVNTAVLREGLPDNESSQQKTKGMIGYGIFYPPDSLVAKYDQLFDFTHIDFLSLIDDIRRSKQCEPNDVLNLTVSLDGTWKKRGHQSMYGIVFLIEAESGYCLDFETLRLRYTNMISDGDLSAYEAVKHTYVNALIKNLIHSGKFTNHSSMDSKDENINMFLSKLSSEQYENNLVTKEDFDEQEEQYQQSLNQFELQSCTRDQINGMSLIDYFKAYMLHHTNQIIAEIFQKLTYFRLNMSHRYQRSSSVKAVVGVSPEVTIDILHCPFKPEELSHLSLCPSYIRSNQSALQPIKHRETQIKNNLKDIKDKVKRQLTNYCKREPPIARMNQYSELLEGLLRQHYLTPLSYADRMRAQREFQLVKSIRRKAQRAKLIIRVCDKGGGLHIGNKIDYERKAAKYRDDTKPYQELSYNPLMEIFTNVTNAINVLKNDKQLNLKNYNRLMPKRDDVRLSYMYFNPKPHKAGTPLRPIMNTIKAVTRPISDFLDELIRPIFDQYNKDNTIIDGVNLIKRLEQYATDGHLKESTQFCTFDINNLYTMLPQDESIRILGDFLRHYVGERIQGISITTIQKLAEIVLKENAFVYDHKFYKQIIGGAMGSPFTLTLANIFMWHWEKRWVRRQKGKNEIYGRYIDDVFFTSNEPIEVVQQLLKDANGWHPNIKLESNIGSSVPFLDILLTNNNGVLHTSVYHKPSAEPYVVPFISDHPRYIFQNIIQTALVRAIRYSSTFEAFNHERRAIRLMLLFNGYPTTYIDKQFRKIFGNYITSNSILPLINNEHKFFQLRKEHMKQPTAQHSQVEARIALFEQNNIDNIVEDIIPMESTTTNKRKTNNVPDKVIIHYTHEKRFTTMKKDMHTIFEKSFEGYGLEAVRLIVGHRNSPNSERELIHKRPPLKYLTLKQ